MSQIITGNGVYRGLKPKQTDPETHKIKFSVKGIINLFDHVVENFVDPFVDNYIYNVKVTENKFLIENEIDDEEFGQEESKIIANLLKQQQKYDEDKQNELDCLFLDLRQINFRNKIAYFKYGQ